MTNRFVRAFRGCFAVAAACLAVGVAQHAHAQVKISQVYTGGGLTTGTPTYNYDYVELFNAGDAPVDLSGWALEYGSASGTWASTTTNIFTFPAGATIQPCGYLLVASTSASSAGAALPVSSDYNFTLTL